MFHSQKGITVLNLLIMIAVIITLAAITTVGIQNAINSTYEAEFKAKLRGVEDRLKLYHEEANLALFTYQKEKLSWDGEEERATNTGKVENGAQEDTAIYIFKEIPEYLQGKIMIVNGELAVRASATDKDEKKWAEEMQILVQ